MVQQETLPPPAQLSSESVQAIVGLLTEHNTCKGIHLLSLGTSILLYCKFVYLFF